MAEHPKSHESSSFLGNAGTCFDVRPRMLADARAALLRSLGATSLTLRQNFRRCRWRRKADRSRTARQSTDPSVAAKVASNERSCRAARPSTPRGRPPAAGMMLLSKDLTLRKVWRTGSGADPSCSSMAASLWTYFRAAASVMETDLGIDAEHRDGRSIVR